MNELKSDGSRGEVEAGAIQRFAFGPFRLDCAVRELRRGEDLVALSPKAFDLLRVLVARSDRVVEKAELMRLVWPDSFVTDDSLTQHVAAVRRALGDVPERSQYILTVPRHGYRFVAPVSVVSDESHGPGAPDQIASPAIASNRRVSEGSDEVRDASSEPIADRQRTSRAWWRSWVAVVILTMLAAAVLGRLLSSRPPSMAPPVTRFIVPAPEGTNFSPSASFLAVSPDGRLLAFLAYRPGEESRIWVRSMDSLHAREIIGTDGALGPFWSPDSQHLGFAAHEHLKTVSLLGEPPRTLCDLEPGHTPSGTWSRDGVILFSQGNAIARIPSAGGVPTRVTEVDRRRGEMAHLLPQFLPDGRHFTYLARGAAGGSINSWIVAASLDGAEKRVLMRASSQALYADPGYLLFVENGALVAQPFDSTRFQFAGAAIPVSEADQVGVNAATPRGMFALSQSGVLAYRTTIVRELGWFDRTGRALGWIGAAGRDANPALSPDGQRVAVSRYDPATSTRNIWMLDLEHGGLASPFTTHFAWANCPVWSADGTRVAFAVRETEGTGDLYEKRVAAMNDASLLASHIDGCPLDWSRDGKSLLVGTSRDAGSSASAMWILSLAGEASPKPLAGPWPRRVWAHLSPNGRWMAYVSDASGRNEIYVRAFPPADDDPSRVSSSGGIDPQWRSDGSELFFLGADQRLMAVPVTTEDRFHAGTPAALFATELDPLGLGISGHNQYVAAADGRRFLLNQPRPDATPSPVMVILNWTAALKR